MKSPRFTLIIEDLKKLGKGALIALGGALLTYLTDIIPTVDFGEYTYLAVAGFSVLANLIRICLKRLVLPSS